MYAILLCALSALSAAPQWPSSLSVSWGPHARRVPIAVANAGDAAAVGETVRVPIEAGSPLLGQAVRALRACDGVGRELLLSVESARGALRREGSLEAGDAVLLPAECPAGGEATLWLYYDNPEAWVVADWLTQGSTNRSLDMGGPEGPTGWNVRITDASHRLTWLADQGRNGSGCVRCEVDAGAEPTWVQCNQEAIPVAVGATYEVRGWVRAENCTGGVGWYLHVNGVKPQLINRVESAGEGTYDWRELRIEFTAPEGSQTATIGTVLHGTGTAWFDDLSFERIDGGSRLTARVGAEERLEGARLGAPDPVSGWSLPVARLDGDAPAQVLLQADLRPAELAWRRETAEWTAPIAAAVTIPGSPRPARAFRALGSGLVACELPARSILTCPVRIEPSASEVDVREEARELSSLEGNLARGGPLDSPSDAAAWGGAVAEGGEGGARATLAAAPDGAGTCLRLEVPREVAPAWVGCRQGPIAIRPGATYLFGALVRADELGDVARIHAHIHDASGKVLTYLSSGNTVAAGSEWTWLSTAFTAPPEAADVQLHLTMNTWGTVYYDNVVLAEAVAALPVRREPAAVDALTVGVVDPIVKLFPTDRIPAHEGEVRLEMGRGEYEPIQLALRLPRGAEEAEVHASPLRSAGGDELSAPTLGQVHWVPIDAPTAYYRAEGPEWARKLPSGSAGSDGWAGWWADPLAPLADGLVREAEGRTVPVWLTYRAPAGAEPGEYRGSVTIRCGAAETELPLVATVRSYALPEQSTLRAVYDLRDGSYPVSIFGAADAVASREAWYRLLAEHRVTPDCPGPEPVFTRENGVVKMDATAFDRWATFCLDELGMNHLYTPWFFYGLGWAYRPSDRFGLTAFSPEWEAAMQEAYRLFVSHLEERGWRERLIHYVSDEPHFFKGPQVAEDLQAFCKVFAAVAPEVPRYSSTWTPAPPLEGAIDLWGAGHYGCFPVEKMRERQAAGDRVLFTTDGQMCLDTPWCATERMLPLYALTHGALGYEFWGVSWWTYDPWEVGWHKFISQSDEGTVNYWIRYPNGDGYLTYPGERFGINGPITSVRLEAAREGQEDAERVLLLRDAVRRLAERGEEVPEAAALEARIAQMCRIPNAGGLRSSLTLPDPTLPARLRAEVSALLESCLARLEARDGL